MNYRETMLQLIKEKKDEKLSERKSFDLSDVCNYLKDIIIPKIPDDFSIAENFRYGLTDAELNNGIIEYRTFLYTLFDKLAADKDKIDLETGMNFNPDSVDGLTHVCCEGSMDKCFPIINDLAIMLFNFGYRGKLETEQGNKLIVSVSDLLTPLDNKNEKYNSFLNITNERKKELFTILSEIGFIFEGINWSKGLDFSETKEFIVKHEAYTYLVVGLKLLADAQAKKKTPYYHLKTRFMRCDFYSLGIKNVKAKDLDFDLFLKPHSKEIKEWIIDMDKYLKDNGCSADVELNNFNSNLILIYISRRTNEKKCKISMGIEGCKVFPYGKHLSNEENILSYLPESMLEPLTDGKYGCTGCATKRPDLVDHNTRYTLNGKTFVRCCRFGFEYSLEKTKERELIKKWLEMELAW